MGRDTTASSTETGSAEVLWTSSVRVPPHGKIGEDVMQQVPFAPENRVGRIGS